MDTIGRLLLKPEYKFMLENPFLGENIMLLTYGGSHAYGTNVETSDTDLRGIAYDKMETLIGFGNYEQFADKETDTVIYAFSKMFKLLLNCDPNTIEILGCKPEHYAIINEDGKLLLDNRKMFLSRNAYYRFSGYANDQLRRLQNALARDTYTQEEMEGHILGSLKNAMKPIVERYHSIDGDPIKYDFNIDPGKWQTAFGTYNRLMEEVEKYKNFEYGHINLRPAESSRDDMKVEIVADVILNGYPLRDYCGLWNELHSIVKSYSKLGKRNNKKDEIHLNKHAMHLIRLHFMCLDILEREEIVTYREDEHDLLMSIRNGDYMKSDGTYRAEFFEMLNDLQAKTKYAFENTSLPEKPDYKAAEEILMDINSRYVVRKSGH